jgi:hypothetical protein
MPNPEVTVVERLGREVATPPCAKLRIDDADGLVARHAFAKRRIEFARLRSGLRGSDE